jgi:hypothetical protein
MIEKLTKDLINKLIIEINKNENKEKIEKDIMNPVFSNFAGKIYPYVSLLFIMYSINLVLIVLILVLIIVFNKKN